jgi:hypothetical protein
MSTTLAPQPAAKLAPFPAAVSSGRPLKTWLVGSWFDLFFVANVAWPVVVLTTLIASIDTTDPLNLFVVYFLSTPHRWITLVLVFCDSERFRKEPVKFGGLAVGLVALGLALVGIAAGLPSLFALLGIEAAAP